VNLSGQTWPAPAAQSSEREIVAAKDLMVV
jgi:hypothetical protein